MINATAKENAKEKGWDRGITLKLLTVNNFCPSVCVGDTCGISIYIYIYFEFN